MTEIDLNTKKKIHVIGIGGAGMAAIAEYLLDMGHEVSGTDIKYVKALNRLRDKGALIRVGHDASVVVDADLITYSTAIPDSNVEMKAANALNKTLLHRSEVLACISQLKDTIAVAGTHGKTTVSSMLTTILRQYDPNCSFIIGGELNEVSTAAGYKPGKYLVIEADESDKTFLKLHYNTAIVTSLESDHLETYGNFKNLKDAFANFLARSKTSYIFSGYGLDQIANKNTKSIGFEPEDDFKICGFNLERDKTRFNLSHGGHIYGEFVVNTPGKIYLIDAAIAAGVALDLGLDQEIIKTALQKYQGVYRRFNFKGSKNGISFLDDYAHLPTEVRETLEAALLLNASRLIAVFQPHRYSRTQQLFRDFKSAFDAADIIFITDVYSAGEEPRPGVTGQLVAESINKDKTVIYESSRYKLAEEIAKYLKDGDLVVSLGAGDITGLSDEIKEVI
jgi:UDP-N-acetylmuramate--alanine ligase